MKGIASYWQQNNFIFYLYVHYNKLSYNTWIFDQFKKQLRKPAENKWKEIFFDEQKKSEVEEILLNFNTIKDILQNLLKNTINDKMTFTEF